MRELRLVGANDDASLLLVVDPDGQQFSLAVDDRLRSAVRRPVLAPGTAASPGSPTISPREMQARIRAGDSAEDVAAATGVPVERVRRYEGPVLAERAHMADSAQRATVRRSASEPVAHDGSSPILYDAVKARLEARGLSADTVRWDAWRREDGRWTVRAAFPGTDGYASADFLFDPRNRASTASDDGARWLLGEEPQREAEQVRQFVPRLAAVGAEGVGAMDYDVRPPASASVPPSKSAPGGGSPGGEDGRRGWSRAEQSARAEAQVRTSPANPDLEPERLAGAPAAPAPRDPVASAEPGRTGSGATRMTEGASRRRRASVPAWDDILFGGGRKED